MQSFVAALQLGLSRRFRGAVDHLRIALDIRLATGDESPRQYLVIYDSVPGGTGYLKELMRDEHPMFEIFSVALKAMDECECNHDPDKDGCYRCVYAYRNSHDQENISRRLAQKLLREILDHRDQLKPLDSLSKLKPANPLFDSELEARFVEALRRPGADPFDRLVVTDVLVKGKPGYQVSCGGSGGSRWRLEPQVELGPGDGVVIPSKPDFVFWPDDDRGDLPVAIFLDGWQFHRDIIAVDLAKRMAIAKSGRFSVWTLTWADVELWLNPKADATVSPWPTLLSSDKDIVGDLIKRLGLGHMLGFRALPSMAQLRMRLCSLDHEMMRRHASILGLGVLMPHGDPGMAEEIGASSLGEQLSESGLVSLPTEADRRMGGRKLGDGMVRIATGISSDQISRLIGGQINRDAEPGGLMYWRPDENTPDAELQAGWHALWQTANLLFPLSRFWAGSDAGCNWSVFQEAPLVRVSAAGMIDLAWIEVAEFALQEVQGWIQALASLDIDAPVVGYELVDEKGRIVAEAELAWVRQQVAVLVGESSEELVQIFVKHGWHCYVAKSPEIDAGLLAILQAKESSR